MSGPGGATVVTRTLVGRRVTAVALNRAHGWAIVLGNVSSLRQSSPADDGELAREIAGASTGVAERAESELCRRFASRIMAYGRRHLGDEAWARDLTQRVLMLTLEKLRAGEVREPDRIASFVLGAARTLSKEIQRKRAREGAALPPEDASSLHAFVPEPEPLAGPHLRGCLERLTERERTIIVLSFFHERGAPEIAEALALSAGNVRVIRHRAIDRLRRCMGLEDAST